MFVKIRSSSFSPPNVVFSAGAVKRLALRASDRARPVRDDPIAPEVREKTHETIARGQEGQLRGARQGGRGSHSQLRPRGPRRARPGQRRPEKGGSSSDRGAHRASLASLPAAPARQSLPLAWRTMQPSPPRAASHNRVLHRRRIELLTRMPRPRWQTRRGPSATTSAACLQPHCLPPLCAAQRAYGFQ